MKPRVKDFSLLARLCVGPRPSGSLDLRRLSCRTSSGMKLQLEVPYCPQRNSTRSTAGSAVNKLRTLTASLYASIDPYEERT